jgi:hypothetical protein
MGYFAHMIQKPWERPLTTLVFQGRKGTGKNSCINAVGSLIKQNYRVTSNERYLTSNFNGHFDSCLCLVLDEVSWGGNKAAESAIKSITTEKRILIERKGKEPYETDNLVRLVILGNADWLVPATDDERRFAVFKMGESKMQDTKFFHEMHQNLTFGGDRILLDYLQKFDLSKTNPNVAPKTEGLFEQKMHTKDVLEKWYFQCLIEGHASGIPFTGSIDKVHIKTSYLDYAKGINAGGWRDDTHRIGQKLRTLSNGLIEGSQRRDGANYVQIFKLPELEELRRQFELKIGREIKWSEQ